MASSQFIRTRQRWKPSLMGDWDASRWIYLGQQTKSFH